MCSLQNPQQWTISSWMNGQVRQGTKQMDKLWLLEVGDPVLTPSINMGCCTCLCRADAKRKKSCFAVLGENPGALS